MVCYKINFDDANNPLCLVRHDANFVIWKAEPIGLCMYVMTNFMILCYAPYRKMALVKSVPTSY